MLDRFRLRARGGEVLRLSDLRDAENRLGHPGMGRRDVPGLDVSGERSRRVQNWALRARVRGDGLQRVVR